MNVLVLGTVEQLSELSNKMKTNSEIKHNKLDKNAFMLDSSDPRSVDNTALDGFLNVSYGQYLDQIPPEDSRWELVRKRCDKIVSLIGVESNLVSYFLERLEEENGSKNESQEEE